MKKYIICFIAVFGLFSCEDFLEEDARSVQTIDNYFTTEAEVASAVNGVYNFVYGPYTKNGFDEMPMAMFEMLTGQWNNVSQNPETELYYRLRNNSGSTYTLNFWDNCYRGIETANLVLGKMDQVDFASTSDRNSLEAEVRFLRAYYYYLLVNIFGDVPMKTEFTTNPAEDGLLPKTPLTQVYNEVIVPDLQFAEANLKFPTPAGNGRVSIGAAKALLAKVYLSMAGNPVNDSNAFELAKNKALEIIESGSFTLFQTDGELSWFEKFNNKAFDNTQEIIWDLNYNVDNLPNSLNIYFLPKEVSFNGSGIQFGGFYPNEDFLDSYAVEDLRGRNNQGFFYNSFTTNGQTFEFPWAIYKYFDKDILERHPFSGKNFPLLRYADVLLTYAEAQNETDGQPNAQAYDAVNAIRERAGLDPVSGMNQEEFREEVWKQRYWELCAENKSFFDIVRTQMVYDAGQNEFVSFVGFELPSGEVVPEDYLPFPIPLREVQINPLLED